MRFQRFAAALFACLSLTVRAQAPIDLPSIGEPADQTLSPVEESKLGASVVRQLRKQGYMLDDPELVEYLAITGRRLVSYSGANPAGFEFFFIKDNRINAFALPGGYIGINAGLLLTTQNES